MQFLKAKFTLLTSVVTKISSALTAGRAESAEQVDLRMLRSCDGAISTMSIVRTYNDLFTYLHRRRSVFPKL